MHKETRSHTASSSSRRSSKNCCCCLVCGFRHRTGAVCWLPWEALLGVSTSVPEEGGLAIFGCFLWCSPLFSQILPHCTCLALHLDLGLTTWHNGKNLPVSAGDMGLIPGSGRFPGGRHGNPLPTHGNPSILAWRIPWTEEPGGLWTTGSQSQTPVKQLSTHMLDVYDCVCINM